MKKSDYIVIFITAGSAEEAQRISKILLERKKAACVNIIDKVNSHFWWEGKLDSAQENLLIAKTKDSLLSDIINLVKEAHGYSVPEIIALPIVGGNQDYLEWIEQSVV